MTSTRSQLCNDNGQWDTTTDCPHACVGSGSCGTIVFTSSVKYAGFLGPPASLAGADQKCQTLAENAMLPGTYRAWLSSSEPMSNPFLRLERPAGPYVLVDGTVVAQNWADLTDGSLQHAIDMTEQRGTPPETPGSCTRGVWTGTGTNGENAILGDGSQAPTCSNWNYPYPQIRGHVGAWDRTDKAWTDDSCALVTCNVSYPLYCIQN